MVCANIPFIDRNRLFLSTLFEDCIYKINSFAVLYGPLSMLSIRNLISAGNVKSFSKIIT